MHILTVNTQKYWKCVPNSLHIELFQPVPFLIVVSVLSACDTT